MQREGGEMEAASRSEISGKVLGLCAAAMSLLVLFTHTGDVRVTLAAAFLAVICVFDGLVRRIPNWATLTLVLAGVLYHLERAGPAGAVDALLGGALGLLLFLTPFLMGGMGAGDVKALAGLGTLLGPAAIFNVFLYTAIAGAVLALFHYAMAHNLREKVLHWNTAFFACLATKDMRHLRPDRTETLRFPYAAAIAAGFFTYVHWGGVW